MANSRSTLDKCWAEILNVNECFPEKIADWIDYKATLGGVPTTYIAWPLLAAIGHASQHTYVQVGKLHEEPTVVYALAVGRSATNKSGALRTVTAELQIPDLRANIFKGGSLDGLMKIMDDNNGSAFGVYDELVSFIDSIDNNKTGNSEKGTYLSLYNCDPWTKTTKTCGTMNIEDPRFNLITFTQPHGAMAFAQKREVDGFFQRFLVTLPREVFVMSADKEEMLEQTQDGESIVDMGAVVNWIYTQCRSSSRTNLQCTFEARTLYNTIHDEVVTYRQTNLYNDHAVSVKGKALGLCVRVAGIVSLMREALMGLEKDNYQLSGLVHQQDLEMALTIVNYSTKISLELMNVQTPANSVTDADVFDTPQSSIGIVNNLRTVKQPIPSPERMTVDFLVPHRRHVQRLLQPESVPMAQITGNKMYPVINQMKGQAVGYRFVNGLVSLGLGRVENVSGKATFKRFHPEDEDCPNRDDVQSKWAKLDLESSITSTPTTSESSQNSSNAEV